MPEQYQSMSHSRWDCKYHIVFVPKYRRQVLFGQIRQRLGPIFHDFSAQRSQAVSSMKWPVHRPRSWAKADRFLPAD